MKENLLTKKLLADGYTKENYPDYIRGWDDFYGGFEYKASYRDKLTYITPCGLHCKGSSAMGGMSFQGIQWEYENDCPTIICPFYKRDCKQTHEAFQGKGCLGRCPVHQIDKEWTYEGSAEEQQDKADNEKERLKEEFIKAHCGRVCENHMKYDPYKKEWSFKYDPFTCASGYCSVLNTSFKDGAACPVLGKVITSEKGNVYYDVRFVGRDYTKDGTLFEGERLVQLIKDVPLFNKPIRLEIAKVIAKVGRHHIEHMVRYNSKWYPSLWMYEAEIGERDLHWSVENIRAEKKIVRDLEADLKDIDDGITVIQEIDERKRIKTEKTAKRQQAKEKRILALEKKILKDDLTDKDRAVIRKYLPPEKVTALRQKREEIEEEKGRFQQMTLFDYKAHPEGNDGRG